MSTQRGGFEFKEVLPRLLAAYEAGRLVPFIGVGLSRPHCADWTGLIKGLEGAAGITGLPELCATTKSEDLIQRANRAVRKLRSGAPQEFEDALGKSLFVARDSLPQQTRALTRIWWPLVISTNYDNFYVKAFADEFRSRDLAVVGRSSQDCQRVLTSLSTAGRALLWTIQGHLASPFEVDHHQADRRLSKELIIDHTEYRRVTHREPHFRRAFAEVFRHRSFLFLGSGLRENYLQELFGEVLELYGPSSHTHFAIMPRGEVDPSFMYSRFQIAVVEYVPDERHREVPDRLEELRGALQQAEAAQTSWSWGSTSTRNQLAQESRIDLEVFRGPLPRERAKGECLVVSAGGQLNSDSFVVSTELQPTLKDWCAQPLPKPRKLSKYVAEYEGCDAFAVRARPEHDDTKDLLQVRSAAFDLFEQAAPRFKCLRMQLLASGGNNDERGGPRYSVRVFPARFAFVEMVRAWGEWRRRMPTNDCRLALHIVDSSVYREIQSGRIDVLELLLCEDVRFWAEIVEREVLVERRQFQTSETTPLGDILRELGLPEQGWQILVSPLTRIDQPDDPVALGTKHFDGRVLTELSVRELGVVPGSTLHFSRSDPTMIGPAV
jgi:hypothetical protein